MYYFCPFCPCHQSLFSTQLLRDHFIVPDLEKDFFRSHFASLIQLARFSSLGSMRSPSRSAFFWNKHPVSSPLFFSIPTTTGRSSHSLSQYLPFTSLGDNVTISAVIDPETTEIQSSLAYSATYIYVCIYIPVLLRRFLCARGVAKWRSSSLPRPSLEPLQLSRGKKWYAIFACDANRRGGLKIRKDRRQRDVASRSALIETSQYIFMLVLVLLLLPSAPFALVVVLPLRLRLLFFFEDWWHVPLIETERWGIAIFVAATARRATAVVMTKILKSIV